MKAERQIYKDVKIDEIPVLYQKCDVAQLKFDGIWARIVVCDGEASIFSQTGLLKSTFPVEPELFTCTLIGEFMYGSQWSKHPDRSGLIYCFDCVEYDGHDLSRFPYIRRFANIQLALGHICDPRLRLVHNYPFRTYPQLLDQFPDYEGLVFRNTSDLYSNPLFRYKRNHEQSGFAVAFYEGSGRLSGTLGSIGVSETLGGKELFRCGGGFSDLERRDIWANQSYYYNREIEVSAKKVFKSGALRHPNFERWKESGPIIDPNALGPLGK
jgi:hypothetical protein